MKKDNYDLIYGQQYTHIRGNQSTTTNGGVKVFVNAAGAGADALTQYHYTIQVGKNANVNIQVDKGDVNVVTTDGDINLKSGKDIVLDAAQGIRLKSKSLDSEQSGEWNETTLNKTENTTAQILRQAQDTI